MTTDPASVIKREVLQLIDLQIEILKKESSLDSSQLMDYQARSARIRTLYAELDRIGEPREELNSTRLPTFRSLRFGQLMRKDWCRVAALGARAALWVR